MAKIQLVHLAHARSGDKGDTANVGVIAYRPEDYDLLRAALTPEAVKAHFGDLVQGHTRAPAYDRNSFAIGVKRSGVGPSCSCAPRDSVTFPPANRNAIVFTSFLCD